MIGYYTKSIALAVHLYLKGSRFFFVQKNLILFEIEYSWDDFFWAQKALAWKTNIMDLFIYSRDYSVV